MARFGRGFPIRPHLPKLQAYAAAAATFKSWLLYYLRDDEVQVFKNVASQSVTLFAFDSATGLPKTGDAANITAYVSKDDGAVTVLTDTSAAETDATNAKGDYLFTLTQAETNADKLRFSAKSTTSGIVVVPVTVYTIPASWTIPLVTTTTTATNVTTVNGLAAGVITAASIATGAIDADALAADAGAEIATAVWTDTTAGDFTVALSVGKSIMNGVSLGTGLTVAAVSGAVGSVTGNVGGNVTGSVGSIATGGIAAASFAAGAINAAAIATGAIDADALAADAIDEIWDELVVASGLTARNAVAIAASSGLGSFSVNDAGATTTGFVTDLTSAVDDFYNDMQLQFTSGALSGQIRVVSDYNGTTKAVTLDEALTSAPANGVTFVLSGPHTHTVTSIQSGLATAAELAKVPKSDGTATWNATALASIQTEAQDALVVHRLDELLNADSDIDGAAPPTVGSVFHELMTKTAGSFTFDQTTDSLEAVRDNMGTAQTGDSYALANGASGFVAIKGDTAAILDDTGTAGVVVAAGSKTGYSLTSGERDSIAAAILKLDFTGLTGEATRSMLNALRKLMNKWAISGSTLTVYKEDDATSAFTQAVSTSASADPVTGLDTA